MGKTIIQKKIKSLLVTNRAFYKVLNALFENKAIGNTYFNRIVGGSQQPNHEQLRQIVATYNYVAAGMGEIKPTQANLKAVRVSKVLNMETFKEALKIINKNRLSCLTVEDFQEKTASQDILNNDIDWNNL